jgi:RNA polymerase sigma-70 factor (ECF subfamily)
VRRTVCSRRDQSGAGGDLSGTRLEFQSVHDRFRPRVLRYLRRLVGEGEAEDLTQSVMVKVSEGLSGFRGDSRLSTWIYRIATNGALDRLRHKTLQPPSETELGSEERDLPPDALVPSVEAVAIRGEMNECIREFVEHLPENYRAVLVLSELEGFKNSEIAAILGISLDTVKIRLHRAREKLRESLETGCSFYRNAGDELACDRKT